MPNFFFDKSLDQRIKPYRLLNHIVSLFLLTVLAGTEFTPIAAQEKSGQNNIPGKKNLELATAEPWESYLLAAYEATNAGNKANAFKFLHQAFIAIGLSRPNDQANYFNTLLKESVKIYRKFNQQEQASKISQLLLEPVVSKDQDEFLKAKLIQERKRKLLYAGDLAELKDDYYLADLFYSSLLAGPSVYANIDTRESKESDYQTKVVDRLVRLYIKHNDSSRAENLVKTSKRNLLFTRPSEINPDSTKRRLAMLEIDMALVKLQKKEYKAAVKLFKKNTIKLERLLPGNKGQLATIYNDYALACYRLGKLGEAKRQYKRALKIANQTASVSEKTKQVIESNYQKFLNQQK